MESLPPPPLPREQARGRSSCNDRLMRRGWYLLLTLPFVGTLLPMLYNHARPVLFGMPFFYWYQLLWVIVTCALLVLVIVLTRERGDV